MKAIYTCFRRTRIRCAQRSVGYPELMSTSDQISFDEELVRFGRRSGIAALFVVLLASAGKASGTIPLSYYTMLLLGVVLALAIADRIVTVRAWINR